MSNIYTSSRGDSHYSEIIMMHQLCAVGFGFGFFFGGGGLSPWFLGQEDTQRNIKLQS